MEFFGAFATAVYYVSAVYAAIGLLICLFIFAYLRTDNHWDICRDAMSKIEQYALAYVAIYMILGFICMLTFGINCIIHLIH